MTRKNLDKVLKDYDLISGTAFRHWKVYAKERKLPEKIVKETKFYECFEDALTLYPNGLAWFYSEKHIGEDSKYNPEDYLKIKQNPEEISKFLEKLLEEGIYLTGDPRSGESPANPADYAIWMHNWCGNKPFKKRFEETIVDLTKRELSRDYSPLNLEEGMKQALEYFKHVHNGKIEDFFFDQDINTTRWRYNLKDPVSEEEKLFVEWYNRELIPTMKVNPHRGNEKTTHFAKTSKEFQEAFKTRYLAHEAKENAINNFRPQFNLLGGLLDIVSGFESMEISLQPLYTPLKEKIVNGFMEDAPLLPYPAANYSFKDVDIYEKLVSAFTKVRKMRRYLK